MRAIGRAGDDRGRARRQDRHIASVYAELGTPAVPHYAASKAGLLGLTRSLAVEPAEHNIQVNAILPGFDETEAAGANVSAERREQATARTPAGRRGRPEELIGPVVFLASAASSYTTGAELAVDGGFLVSPRWAPREEPLAMRTGRGRMPRCLTPAALLVGR